MNHDETGPGPDLPPDTLSRRKVWIALTLIVAIVIGLLVFQSYLDRDGLVEWSLQREHQLQDYHFLEVLEEGLLLEFLM